nr:radical SAM family heme chaperone HemW [Pseudomonadota bacterium]
MNTKNSIGIYIHIPYCILKCPYCDFNSYTVGKEKNAFPEEAYTKSLLSELTFQLNNPAWQERECHSVFFGGGTPSLFSPASIDSLISAIKRNFRLTTDAEITLEANPGTLQEELIVEKLAGFREAGVNRISMGAQSFNPEKLKFLGRIHSPEESLNAVKNIKASGFKNFNLDLIYAVNNESREEWESDLRQAIALEPNHISAYCLTIEPGTEFGKKHKKGLLKVLDEEVQAKMYEQTLKTLEVNSYYQYEVSNFSKTSHQCRHNLTYWNWSDYLGLGAGAHSFLKSYNNSNILAKRWSNIPGPNDYIQRANEIGNCQQ